MNPQSLVHRIGLLAGLLGVMGVAPRGAAAQSAPMVESFTATTIGMNPGAGEQLTIQILHWSTEANIEKLVAAFKDKGEKEWNNALQASPSVGYIWTKGEGLGYSIHYAQRSATPDGGERVLLATDRPLGSRGQAWKAIGPAATDSPFSVLELRVNRTGLGEGKTSLAGTVMIEGQHIAIENYTAAPVLLRPVKRSGGGDAPTTVSTAK